MSFQKSIENIKEASAILSNLPKLPKIPTYIQTKFPIQAIRKKRKDLIKHLLPLLNNLYNQTLNYQDEFSYELMKETQERYENVKKQFEGKEKKVSLKEVEEKRVLIDNIIEFKALLPKIEPSDIQNIVFNDEIVELNEEMSKLYCEYVLCNFKGPNDQEIESVEKILSLLRNCE